MSLLAAVVVVLFILLVTTTESVTPAYAQDEDEVARCSLTEFDPKCSPSGWVAFILGEVIVALIIAVILFRLQHKTEMRVDAAITRIKKIVSDNEEIKRKQMIFANQALKNYFGVILMITGLMDRALANAKTYEDVPANIRDKQDDLIKAVNHASSALSLIVYTLNPLLADQMRRFFDMIDGIDPRLGVGKGFPEYASIKKEIAGFTEKLDAEVDGSDTVLK